MPFLVEIDTPVWVAPNGAELAIDLTQLGQALHWDFSGQLQRQTLQARQNSADFSHFGAIQWHYAESPSHVGRKNAFARQSEQCFSNRGAAYPQLRG